MIVNHLKSQGLFDQFRRDCLADVDTKPAYQNLRQRVDNFVANHLATHTWSPHLNKNQLRNNIRQQVLKSGMLESGIDRIISQVVDPKINHTFRPQVEKAVHEFLATLNHKEEASSSAAPEEEKPESAAVPQGAPAPGPSANVASDAMSILETITSLNQEASAARASTETSNAKSSERVSKKLPSQPSTEGSADRERPSEDMAEREKPTADSAGEGHEAAPKSEELNDLPCPAEEMKTHTRESSVPVLLNKDAQPEISDQKGKSADKAEKKLDGGEKEKKKEKKEKAEKKLEHSKRSEDTQKVKDEKQAKEKEVEGSRLPPEKNSNKSKATEGSKEDCSLMDSDVDGLTDITVSSVHTSDLSSFEEDTEEEVAVSDSMEEGEITSDDEKSKQSKAKTPTGDPSEGKAKSVRQAYVHKPYLYSKYYSDSDDELTVEQRRQSVAKEKEERLLRRQINREKLEEKRKQKAEKTKSSKAKSQGKSNVDLEESSKNLEPKAPGIKEVLKERKVLEKKVALSKKRKKDSRNVEENSKKKQQSEEDTKETPKATEHCEKEKASSSKDLKHVYAKTEPSKPTRRLSESLHPADENKNEREHKRRTSTPVLLEAAQEETDTRDGKRPVECSDVGPEETQKPRSTFKNEKHVKKDDSEAPHLKSLPRKEARSSSKEKSEKEKTLSEDKPSVKHKYKGDGVSKTGEETEPHSSEKGVKVDESGQKQSQLAKLSSDDKAERKSKHRNERKLSVLGKDGKPVSEYIIKTDENARKENKKERHMSTEKTKAEHKSRRLSDSKIQKDSLSSRQHGIPLPRRSESYSEDKCETDLTNLDSNVKPEEAVHKEKRRTKSLVEEKLTLKSKSKSQGKLLKVVETELQESVTRQSTTAKPEKEKNTEESDPDRQRKSKVEEKPEETGSEPLLEGSASSAHGTQKDSSHRAKLSLAKEKYKGERDSSSSRLERRLSDGHKSRSLKHSKDLRKKEENKSDDRDGKEVDGNHDKARGNSSVTEKKLSRRLCENRRGSLSQEITKGEEKLSVNTLGTSSLQRPKKSGETALIPEQEPMETDSELATESVSEVSKTQDSSTNASQQDVDSENVTKQKAAAAVPKEELRTSTGDAKTVAPASKSRHGAGLVSNSEKHADHRSSQTKKVHAQSAVSKLNPGEKEATQPGTHETNVDLQSGPRMLPRVLTGNGRAQKNVKNTVRPTEERGAPREAALEHSTDANCSPHLGSVTLAPQTQSLEADVMPLTDKRPALEGGKATASRMNYSEIPNQSLTVRESEVPRTHDSKDSGASTGETPAKAKAAGMDSKRHTPEGCQAASLLSKQGKGSTSLGSEVTAIVETENADKEGSLTDRAENKCDLPNSKQTVRAAVENGRKDGVAVDCVVGMSTERDVGTVERKGSRDPGEVENTSAEAERKNGNSEVDTSARNATAAASVPHQTNGEAENVAARCVGAEKTPIATSTEGKLRDVALNPAKAGDASTTSSETGAGKVAVPCTSIEADEGVVAGVSSVPLVGAEASGGTVFAAAEEGGGVVTEGFAESETFLTSTKEGESGECSTGESGGRAERPVTAHATAVEDNRRVGPDEKDDAVTSAGSEEKCDGSSSRDSELVEGATPFISEIECDGAVTSAGTEIRAGSVSSEEVDGFQRTVTRMGPKKETEGAVTCTGAERRGETFARCSVTHAGAPEELMVTGAAVVLVDDTVPLAAGTATPEQDGPANDGTEGESAVTSTGITEDGEGPARCTGLEETNDSFPLSSESEENGESAMDSTVAKEVSNAPLVAAGLCDDEGIVTSTGAKEEDDEGEGVVTSTGRGNEVGHASTCTGAEEESEGVVMCESAEEGLGRMGTAVGLVEAEAGAAGTNAHEGSVDSMSGAEKKVKDPEICSSAKGVVESSVTSAVPGKGEVAGVAVGSEGPMTSATAGKRDSQLSGTEKLEDAAISTGLVGGSYEALVSGAVPAYEVHDTLPSEKEDEGAITSVENESCVGLVATIVRDSVTNHTHTTVGKTQGKGLIISTSWAHDYTTQPGQTVSVEEGRHLCALRSEQQREGPGGNVDEFEAPMPSALSGAENQTVALRSEEKDECAMISTSLGEDFDVPISSATTVKCSERQQPEAAVEERVAGPALVSTDDFEVPMPSAPAQEPESPLASTSKEEKDECALISTSIAEGCEASVSGGAVESGSEPSTGVTEEKDGSAVISTSSVEDCEGPVSSAAPREEVQPSVTLPEETSDTTMISTSTSEGCEAVMMEAAPQDEGQPAGPRAEDSGDAAIISTSTAECLLTMATVDRHKESPAADHKAGRDEPSAARVSRCEVPMPSQMAENSCPHPGPFTGEVGSAGAMATKEGQHRASDQPSTENERHGREPQSENISLLSTGEKLSLSSAPREPKTPEPETVCDGTLRDLGGSSNSPTELRKTEPAAQLVSEDSPVSAGHGTAVNTGATRVGATAHVSNAALERSSRQDQRESGGNGKATTQSSPGHESATTVVAPAINDTARATAPCEQNLTPQGEPRDGVTKLVQEEVTDCPEESVRDTGNEEASLNISKSSEQETASKSQCVPPKHEREEVLALVGSTSRGAAELQRDSPLADESLHVENSGSQTTEEVPNKSCDPGEIPSGSKDNPEAKREPDAEADSPKVEEEEKLTPKRKRRKLWPSSEDELDDNPDILEAGGETAQKHCSSTEPQDTRDENSGDLDDFSKISSKASSTASGTLEEKDEYSSGEAAGDKTEQIDDDNIKSQEEDQPIVIKRKRGRPRKYPVDPALKSKEDFKADPGIVTVEQSPPGGKPKVTQTDESSKEAAGLQERSVSNDEEDKTVASMRRRGRKAKRPPALSDDAESSEPERKRHKSVSETAEDKKDQESEEDEEEEEEEEPSGATTRSTTRSEAQRKRHSQSPARAAAKLGSPATVSPRNRQKLAKEKLSTSEKVSNSPPLGRSKAQLSPSAKRRREVSPPGARTRGQQRVEETPAKKAKR